MHIITFITDCNSEDYYLGAVKGQILLNYSDNNISFVNISNNVNYCNTEQVLYILRGAYNNFPKGTIHVININNKPNEIIEYIVVKFDGYYFIAPNTGLLDLLVETSEYEAFKIPEPDNYDAAFPEISYIPESIEIIIDNKLKTHTQSHTLIPKKEISPIVKQNVIIGTIIYIDGYGNIITNISKEIFEKNIKKSKFSILLKNKNYMLDKISNGYSGEHNHIIALFNSRNLLEIAHILYPANKSLGLLIGDKIKIEYHDN